MRRALASLKYVPAVLCGLLVVAWPVSWFVAAGVSYRFGNGQVNLEIWGSHLDYVYNRTKQPQTRLSAEWTKPLLDRRYLLGHLTHVATPPHNQFVGGRVYFRRGIFLPLPLLITVLLPLSIAPFTRFRFPLWSYFAWTALLAAELAYYLR
jgi:hypothetical protein